MPRLYLLFSWLALSVAPTLAHAVGREAGELTKTEIELIQICEEMDAARDEYFARYEKLSGDAERAKYAAENDPYPPYVDELIEFERANHGSHAGLMAARQLVLLGAGGGEPGNSRELGRRHAVTVLGGYANAPELPWILRYLGGGTTEPKNERLLRQLIDAADIPAQNRAYAQFTLAEWALNERDKRDYQEHRLRELAEGAPERYWGERKNLSQKLAHALPPEKLAGLKTESLEILESLTNSSSDLRMRAVSGVDEGYRILCFDPEKTKDMPRMQDLAAGLLFKERHLTVGNPAPPLQLKLVSGDTWSLADQTGKAVVIQFGFKGCGPCEAMYPDLRAMAEDYPDNVSILTITADEKLQDTMEGIESDKVTWNVSWDGPQGPVATQWGVDSFPTIYVVGPDGTIAATDVRGDPLRAKISELVR